MNKISKAGVICCKLDDMFYELAIGVGDIRSRLATVFDDEWSNVSNVDEYPDELKSQVEQIKKTINEYENKAKRTVSPEGFYWMDTFVTMRNNTASQIADELWDLRTNLRWWLEKRA